MLYLRIRRANILNILLYIDIFYWLFIPVSFVKLHQLILSWHFLQEIWKFTVLNGDVTKRGIIMSGGYYFGILNKIAIKAHGRLSRHRKCPESYHTHATPIAIKV